MAKRFTDTDKWKKPFIRGLQGAYKLLWFYILDDCDHAGIWQVDFEVAQIRIGEPVNQDEAIKIFGDRVEIFNNGSKWFLRDFIDFQYGPLKETNRLHQSVINILQKQKIGPYKPLAEGQGQEQGIIQGNGQGQIQGQGQGEFEIFDDWIFWGNQIVGGNDAQWEAMRGRKVTRTEMDSFLSVATRNKWKMETQGEFRISLKGFEVKSPTNGQVNQKERFKNL